MLATCALLAAITALLINALLPLRGRLATWLGLGLLCAAQIVLLAEALSELRVLGRAGFVAGHVSLLVVVLLIWWRVGRPPLLPGGRISVGEVRRAVTSHRMLAVFSAMALLLAGLALLAVQREPQISYDAVTYHLPRALTWLDNGTARHFPTDNHRQIEFPPNVSFYFAWIMALNGPDLVELPNWLAGVGLIGATAGIARLAGYSRAAAVFAGVLFFVMPQPFNQLTVAHIDLATAFPGVCLVYFAWRSIAADAEGTALRRNTDLVYAGLACGVFLGSKYTALYLLPGAAVVLLGYAAVRSGVRAWRPLAALALVCGVGFVLLGSYNYALNLLDFGNPITDQDITASSDLLALNLSNDPALRPHFFSFPANLVRYSYAIMDWQALDGLPLVARAEALHRWPYQRVDDAFGLHLAATPGFAFSGFGSEGFGIVGYAAFVLSPLVVLHAALRQRRRRVVISAVWVLVAWSWLLLFAATSAWSPWKTRYFPVFMPFIVAAVVPAWYEWGRRTRITSIALGVMLVFALWTGVEPALYPIGRWFAVSPDPVLGYTITDARVEAHYRALHQLLPKDGVVGVAGRRVDLFDLVRYVPDRDYVAVTLDDAAAQVASGAVDVLLLQAGHCAPEPVPYTMLAGVYRQDVQCVHVADHAAFLQRSPFVTVTDSVLRTEFGNGAPVYVDPTRGAPRVVLRWLAEQLPATAHGYHVEVAFEGVIHAWAVSSVLCGDYEIVPQVVANRVAFEVPRAVVAQNAPVVLCQFAVDEPAVSGHVMTVRAVP